MPGKQVEIKDIAVPTSPPSDQPDELSLKELSRLSPNQELKHDRRKMGRQLDLHHNRNYAQICEQRTELAKLRDVDNEYHRLLGKNSASKRLSIVAAIFMGIGGALVGANSGPEEKMFCGIGWGLIIAAALIELVKAVFGT